MKKLILIIVLFIPFFTLFSQSSKILFENSEHNFGDINEKDGKVSHKFSFKNDGDQPLLILSVKPSCGCTTPNWSKNPINPGDEGFIIAEYNPKGRPGIFRKSLNVLTNQSIKDKPNNIYIYIKGKVLR
jgi:hypothetical protein|tara:strand:+ start:59994 stop:60380 length:387 start_codon:yes stop_codon:yes gene_type:complete